MPYPYRYLRTVRASAWYDVIATALFVTPWTFDVFWRVMNRISASLALAPMPAFEPMHVLFANLLGSVVLVWAAVRLWKTTPVYGLFDGIARALFALWQAVALYQGASLLIWPFLVAELAFCVAQLLPLLRSPWRTQLFGASA
jgi:hypothetical protein